MKVRNSSRWSTWVSVLILLVLVLPGAAPAAAAPALGNDVVKSITIASQSGDYRTPLDSTPDPDGHTIYFTATGSHGPGVFKVDANGGKVAPVAAGAPFVAPRGSPWAQVATPST